MYDLAVDIGRGLQQEVDAGNLKAAGARRQAALHMQAFLHRTTCPWNADVCSGVQPIFVLMSSAEAELLQSEQAKWPELTGCLSTRQFAYGKSRQRANVVTTRP